MVSAEECRFVGLHADGRPILEIHGQEQPVDIAGVILPPLAPDAYREIFRRIERLGRPLRCIVLPDRDRRGLRAQISYYGWQDKSGDVWQDLATLLLAEGVVRAEEDRSGDDGA